VDPDLLEKLRDRSGLRLDKEGQFFHQGEPILHGRTNVALHRGIHRAPNGRWATRIGKDWSYLDVEDAAFWVRRIDGTRAQLTSGEWVELEPGSMTIGPDDALYARVNGERARLTRPAQLALAGALHEENGVFTLDLAGQRRPISPDQGPEPVRPPP
jgi:hypothetical protein